MPHLHERFPRLRETLPYIAFGRGPTPVRPLEALAPGLWLKDEAGYGDGGWGGNKVRKLEWALPEARRRGARTVLTFGALGTNHGLATALYARDVGLRCALALVDQPVDDHVRAQIERLKASGATLHFTHTRGRTIALLPWLMLRHRNPFVLPAGGSRAIGVVGWVEAGLEIAHQVWDGVLPEPAAIVVPVGTGGTAAGLALAMRIARLRTRVVGVVVNDGQRLDEPVVARLARRTARLLTSRGAMLPHGGLDLDVRFDQLGPGYGVATEASTAAQALARERAGLRLDPVYTAKAMAAVLAGSVADGPVLFIQTYGPR